MKKVLVSTSPHIHQKQNTRDIMLDVCIALLPALAFSVWNFGIRALGVVAACVASCVATEWIMQKLMHRRVMIADLSSVVTGILLAFNMPVSVPIWVPIIGGIISIGLVKELFGGIGNNVVNPALAGRVILAASWPALMSDFSVARTVSVTGATPLAAAKAGEELPSLLSLLIGNVQGCIGEVSALALILGGVYLIVRKVITWHTPVAYIVSVFVLGTVFGYDGLFTGNGLYQVLSGGLLLGAIYMATDYTTSPLTGKGKLIMGVGCAIFTVIIRVYGGYAEGVSFSILLMNVATPLIDRFTEPKIYGGADNGRAKKV